MEPSEPMLERLRAVSPHVTALHGSGESLPLDDASADAVTYGQAWHWVDPGRASTEAARVLRPGGVLGLVWNLRRTDDPVGAALAELIGGEDTSRRMHRWTSTGSNVGPEFGRAERTTFQHEQALTRDESFGTGPVRSYIVLMPEDVRAPLLEQVGAMHDDLAVDGSVTVKYETTSYRARLPVRSGGSVPRDVAQDRGELLRAGPHRPVARRQVDLGHVAQLGQAGEQGIALFDGLLVLLGGEPGRDDGARHVEAGVVGELRRPVDDAARLGHRPLLERRQLLRGEPVEVFCLGEGLRRRHRQVWLGRLGVGLALAGAGVDIDHGRDLLRDAVGDGIARGARSRCARRARPDARRPHRVADRVDMVGEGDRRTGRCPPTRGQAASAP